MNVRLWMLIVLITLTAIPRASAAFVVHEFTGVVAFSSVSGVSAGNPFTAMLSYNTSQPDLEPANLSNGRYAEFTFSLNAGSISVSQTNPVNYDFGIIDGTSGLPDQIVWFGSIAPGDIGLSASNVAGAAFASDALPLSLSISNFGDANIRHFVTSNTRIDGVILAISSRIVIVPEPSSLAIFATALSGGLVRRFRAPGP